MDTAVVYHLWCEQPPEYPRALPIIASIASLRAVNQTVPVYVLSCGTFAKSWAEFPELLDFKVVPISRSAYEHYAHLRSGTPFDAGRPADIWRFAQSLAQRTILYCDSDVFWLKNPFPLEGDLSRVCMRFLHQLPRFAINNGIVYFDRLSPAAAQWHRHYDLLTHRSFLDDEFYFEEMIRTVSFRYTMVASELISAYMLRAGFDALFADIPRYEHVGIVDLHEQFDLRPTKLFHAHDITGHRAFFPLYFTELRDILTAMIPRTALLKLYTPEKLEEIPQGSIYDLDRMLHIKQNHRTCLSSVLGRVTEPGAVRAEVDAHA